MTVKEPDFPVQPDGDEEEIEPNAVLGFVARQMVLWREGAGLTRAQLAKEVGYGENLVYKVERGVRIPRPEYLVKVDVAVGAQGKVAAMSEDIAEARYPKKLPTLIKLEKQAVELGAYGNHNLHGLLQTEEYARALFAQERPAHTPEQIDELVRDRLSRQEIFQREPMVTLTFVQEEATLRRPIGGRAALRRQLTHILELSRLRNVELQVMPTATEEHAGTAGQLQLLKIRDGRTFGYSEAQAINRLVDDPKSLQVQELRYGIIRAQALTPRRSQEFIEQVLGDGTC